MNAKVEKISSLELIEEIESFDVDGSILITDMKTSEATIRQYKTRPKVFVKKTRTLSKFLLLKHALIQIKKLGYENSYEVLKQLSFQGVSAIDIINQYSNTPVAQLTIDMLISTLERRVDRISPIEEFREKYKYINEETMEKASFEEPKLLVSIFNDRSTSPLLKGELLEALAIGSRNEYYDFIKSKWGETSAFIRESVALALFEYKSSEKFQEIFQFYNEKLETEAAPGVRKTLTELLNEMEFEANVLKA